MTPEQLSDLTLRAYQHQTPWTAEQFAQSLSTARSLLATTDHAFVLGQVVVDEVEILALAADPLHQRQGQASGALVLFHRLAAERGATRAFLEVAGDNAPARALYIRHGYAKVGLRPAYYPRPDGTRDDALIMSRALP